MIATIDLIPQEIHEQRRQRARFRAYAFLSAAMALVIGSAGAYSARRAGEVKSLAQVSSELEEGAARLKRESHKLSDELARTRKVLQDVRRLKQGHRWSRVLTYIASQVSDSVLLVMVSTDPPEPGKAESLRNRSRKTPEATREKRRGPRVLAMRGYALEHKDLATFLGNLKGAEVFDSVALLHTRLEPFLDGEGIAFTLTCHW